LERETAPFSFNKYLQESTMNDRIQNQELNRLFQKLNLPKDLTYQQMQEIALYAAYKLDEQKKKAEKIIFNPTESDSSGMTQQPLKSDANLSHLKYKLSNQKKK
jgi:hypothetical protein